MSDSDTMDRFIGALCGIPDVKSKLLEHLLPSLDLQIQDILKPLKDTVSELESKLKHSKDKCIELERKTDDPEQYTRRQNIHISGIPENAGEDTDGVVVDFAKTVLDVDIDPAEIDRSHRVGQKTSAKPTRDMTVRFVSYKSKVKIMKTKNVCPSLQQSAWYSPRQKR